MFGNITTWKIYGSCNHKVNKKFKMLKEETLRLIQITYFRQDSQI